MLWDGFLDLSEKTKTKTKTKKRKKNVLNWNNKFTGRRKGHIEHITKYAEGKTTDMSDFKIQGDTEISCAIINLKILQYLPSIQKHPCNSSAKKLNQMNTVYKDSQAIEGLDA